MREIKIDFDNPGFPQRLDVVENDAQSRFFKAVLYKDGKAYTAPSGATYSIMYRGFGPQNEGWYDTINDGAGKRAACSVSGNVVTCEIARQALRVPGHVSVVLCVTGSNGYMLHGWPIDCNCRNDSYTGGTSVESFFYITQITNADWTSAIKTWEELKNMIDPTLSVEGKAADAAKVGEAVGQLKEDLNHSNDGKQRSTCDYGIDYPNAQIWEPTNYITVPVFPEFDGKISKINVKASETGTISIVVLKIDGAIYSGIKATEESRNSYEVAKGDNTISCAIDIQKGNIVAFKPSGCSIYYENNESGLYTYIYNGSTLDRPGDYKRSYGFSYDFIHDNNEHLYVEHKFSNIDTKEKYTVYLAENSDCELVPYDDTGTVILSFTKNINVRKNGTENTSISISKDDCVAQIGESRAENRNGKLIITLKSHESLCINKFSMTLSVVTSKNIKTDDTILLANSWANIYAGELLPLLNRKKIEKVDGNTKDLSKYVSIYVEDVKDNATVYSSLFYGDSIANITAPSDVEPFIFFTDPHTLDMNNWQSGCESLMLLLKNYYDATPVSYVLCGGDWIGNSDLPKVSCYKLGLIHGMMRKLFERYYYVIGNHDTNYQGKLTDESEKYTTRLSQTALQNLLYNGEKTYYVFQGNRTRFYCLDTGVEWSSLSTYYSEEMEWFAENLAKDNSRHIAILLHILYSSESKTTISSEVTKIAEAYNGRSTITVNEKSYDFSQCKGKIEFYLAGHTHADSNGLEGSIPYVITRKAFELQKPTFDLTMVDYDNRVINMIRVGNGDSRKISLDSGKIIS